MFGAAAARHLAEAGHRVVLVAPMEPLVPESHDGVFASHYDEARITRVLDPDPLWAQLAHASINRYADLEASTGIRFHHGTGFLTLREAGSALLSATTRAWTGFLRSAEARMAAPVPSGTIPTSQRGQASPLVSNSCIAIT